MIGALIDLARGWFPRAKSVANEGEYRPGPYHVSGGWLPAEWGQYLNFWQMDHDPLPFGSSSIVEACVWAYVRAIAQLPGYHKRELGNGGTEFIFTSALSRVLRSPNGYQTPSDFLVHLVRSLLLTGNSYWIAQRNERREVTALHWTNPRHCAVHEVTVEGSPFKEVFYSISESPLLNLRGADLVIPARDVLHIKLATPRHPLVGETWLASLTLELASRAAISGQSVQFARNMSRPSGVLQTDLVLTKTQMDELRERWNEQAKGWNAGGVPILSNGLKFQPVSLSQQDQQTIEQQKLTDRTVAAVFGVPPMLVGISDAATQKSAEAVMAEWLSNALGWLIDHIERSFDQFFGLANVAEGREWTEYDTRVLLRSLFKERIEGLVRGVQGGVFAPNEARAIEGYGAAEGGDEPRVQQQLVPLSFATEPPPPPAPPVPAEPPDDDETPLDDEGEPLDDDDRRAIIAARLRKAHHDRIAA